MNPYHPNVHGECKMEQKSKGLIISSGSTLFVVVLVVVVVDDVIVKGLSGRNRTMAYRNDRVHWQDRVRTNSLLTQNTHSKHHKH